MSVELFAALPGMARPISDSEVIYIAHLSESARQSGRDHRHVMTFDVHAALGACQSFASLEQHAKALAERFPQLPVANIERVLQSLVQRGLLLGEQGVRAELTQGTGLSNARPIAGIAIISHGHPAALEALLTSATEMPPVRDRSFAMVDLSEDAEHRARKVELMAEFGRRTGQRVLLLEQKRERWLSERIEQFPEHERGLQQLFGKAAGAKARALNLISASYAGERVLVIDDSARLRTYGELPERVGLVHTAHRRAQFYDSAAAAFDAHQPGASLWELGERYLGQGVGSFLPQMDFTGLSVEDFDGYRHARAARLQLGVLGSADTAHSLWGFAISAAQHATLVSRDDVQAMLSGDAVRLSADSASLAPSIGLACQGIDLRQGAAFAYGENDGAERLWNQLSRFIDASGMVLTLPVALERRGAAEPRALRNRETTPLTAARFLSDHVSQWESQCVAQSASARLRWLAAQALDLSEAPAFEREEMLWRHSTARRAEVLADLQRLLAAATKPSEAWRYELIAVIQAQAEAMMQSAAPHFESAAKQLSLAAALSESLQSFAAAAQAWEALGEPLASGARLA